MKVLSLFDRMACGILAMKSAGIEVIAHLIRGVFASVDENPIVPEKGRQTKLDEWVVEE